MDPADLAGQLDQLYDSELVHHGFTEYMRDYELIVFQSTDPLSGIAPRHLRFLFRCCPEASVRSALAPAVWSRSMDDQLLDQHHVTMQSSGYVWGVQGQELYPGAAVAENSERAQWWSEQVGVPFHEVEILANAHQIRLIFTELQVEEVAAGLVSLCSDVMTWTVLAAFAVAVLPIVVTPGASFTLVTQRSLAGERAAGRWVIAGTATGIYTHATLAALGLSAIVMRSSQVFVAVKLAGAAYLIGLGVMTLWRSRGGGADPGARRRSLPWAGLHPYPQAVLANVLNPKAAAVYLTLAPQFLTARDVGLPSMLALATVHVLIMVVWLGVWSVALSGARRLTQFPGFRTWVNRAGGAVLVALGVRTAVTAA